MTNTPRVTPFFIYLVPALGWLAGLTVLRRNVINLYHACQALALTLGVLVVPAAWAVGSWIVAWIPLVGPVTAVAGFALVMAAAPTLAIVWLIGLSNALLGKAVPLPMVGAWGEAIFRRLVVNEEVIAAAEVIEEAETPTA